MVKNKKTKTLTSCLYVRGIPATLQSHFRAWCVLRGISVRSKIMEVMRETIQETRLRKE